MAVEDYCGLWEAKDVARITYPQLTEIKLQIFSEKAIRNLLARKLILIFYGTKFSGEQIPIRNVNSVLKQPKNWQGEKLSKDGVIRFAATKTGESFYYETN